MTTPSNSTTLLQLPLYLNFPAELPYDALSYCKHEFELAPGAYGLPHDGCNGFLPAFVKAVKLWLPNPDSEEAFTSLLRNCLTKDTNLNTDADRLKILSDEEICLAHPRLIWALLQQPGQLILRLCYSLFGVSQISGLQVLLRKKRSAAHESSWLYSFRAQKGLDTLEWHHEIQTTESTHGRSNGVLVWKS